MTVTAIGELKLSAELPQVSLAFGNELLNVQAQVSALLAFTVAPPSFEADLDVAAQNIQALTLAVSLGITPPSISVQLAEVAAQLSILLGQLALLNALAATLEASAHLYTYTGTVGALGTELQAELSGGLPGGSGADAGFAVVFVATAPAAVTALQSLFKTTP